MLNKIGYYQFDNLVKNRIPFMFINMGEDVSSWYQSIYKLHIQTYQILTTLDQAETLLIEKQIPKDFAILLLCQNGKQSENFTGYLERNGYTNVYLVDGGIQQMMTDKVSL
jgi:rhodanese-related sulfurtransferase